MRHIVLLLILLASAANAQQPVFRWGGDAEGGAPFVEADPSDPSKLRGFDVEVAGQIAKGLGKRPEFVQVSFSDIDQSVQRGDFEIGMSGVEDTPPRRRMLDLRRAARTSSGHPRRNDRVRACAGRGKERRRDLRLIRR